MTAGSARIGAAVAALLLTAGCGDDGDMFATSTTTTTSTTEAERVSTAGLLDPPEGYTQTQTDGFVADLVPALADLGWPSFGEADVHVLGVYLIVASTACDIADTEPAGGEAFVADVTESGAMLDDLVTVLTRSGVDDPEALVVAGADAAFVSSASLCPEHADILTG